jgi:DNA-binding transcriptional LysR family regulator
VPVEFRDLRAFVVLAEELHFGRASTRLNMTASPLTRQIQKIERELGVRLFERTKRTVATTVAGNALLEEARSLLERRGALADRLQRVVQGGSGVLHVGVIGIAVLSQARDIQARIVHEVPDVRVTWRVMSSADQVAALRQGRLDVGFLHTPIEHEGLEARRLVRETMVVALPAGHPLTRRKSLRLRDLRHHVFLVGSREQSPGDYDRLISGCNAEGFSPKIDPQTQSLASFLGLVAIGVGVALTPASISRSSFEGVAFVPVEGASLYSEISIAWNPAQVSPVLSRMLGWFTGPDPRRKAMRRPARGKPDSG